MVWEELEGVGVRCVFSLDEDGARGWRVQDLRRLMKGEETGSR